MESVRSSCKASRRRGHCSGEIETKVKGTVIMALYNGPNNGRKVSQRDETQSNRPVRDSKVFRSQRDDLSKESIWSRILARLSGVIDTTQRLTLILHPIHGSFTLGSNHARRRAAVWVIIPTVWEFAAIADPAGIAMRAPS